MSIFATSNSDKITIYKESMQAKRGLIIIVLLFTALVSTIAKPRSEQQIQAIAQQVMASKSIVRHAPKGKLKILEQSAAMQVIGFDEGGYVIVSADDVLPAVLGYSSEKFADTGNPNFEWWLKTVESTASARIKQGAPLTITKPDISKYAESVAPLVTCTWGQDAPYNNLCPSGQGPISKGKTVTGCVATAMAQILYYWRFPEHGQGSRTIYFPFDDPDGQALTADFGNTHYDWDHMIDDYSGTYTQEEATAVATLMYHCGIATNMQYDASGSGAYATDAAEGLKNYFGLPSTVRYVERDQYSEPSWMDMIYNDVNSRQPILYVGADASYGGHAFVLDGYDKDGLVHINWGWDGDQNGFFDVSLLNPTGYQFEFSQGMIIGIRTGQSTDLLSKDITLTTAGTLSSQIDKDDMYNITSLRVAGPINSTDLKYIRRIAGRDSIGRSTRGLLQNLDLKDARIVAGGEPYMIDGNRQLATEDNALPERAFYDCEGLRKVVLPSGVRKFGNGVFSMCLALDTVVMPTAQDAEYVYEDSIIYNVEKTSVLQVMPFKTGRADIAAGVTQIEPYGAAGCPKLERIILPSTIQQIGTRGLYFDFNLVEVRSFSRTVPVVGANVFDDVNVAKCKLYVPGGTKERYSQAPQWKDFIGSYKQGWNTTVTYDNIIEFGTTLTARNAVREYGEENPTFGYKIGGDVPNGKPELTCSATPTSPVGDYDIVISRGTVTDEIVDFVNGKLTVMPALLTVKADTITMVQGQEIPELTLSYSGFRNGETDTVFITLPVATTTATSNSPAGDYPIIVSGGETMNYDLEYIPGVLHITGTTDGINGVKTDAANVSSKAYDLQGRSIDGRNYHGVVILEGKKYIKK